MEPLIWVTPAGKPRPWLARSVTQPRPTTYVYHLRRGVKFWNGNEMTSADVVNSLKFHGAPKSALAHLFTNVRNIKAADRYTVVVTLKAPDVSWPYNLTKTLVIFEKKFQQQHKATFGKPGTLVMGTGPWKIDSLNPATGAEFSANPRWWGGKVDIQRISLKFFADETSMALAFRSGEIDTANLVFNVNAFASTAGARVVSAPDRGFTGARVLIAPSTLGVTLGMNTIQSPWNDVHVRRAVAYAINRRDIIKASGLPAGPRVTFMPVSSMYQLASRSTVRAALKKIPSYPFDLERAKQEMANSAYPNGFSAEFNTTPFGGYPDMAQVVAAQLAKIGINLKVNSLELGRWFPLIAGEKRGVSGIQFTAGCCATADPDEVLKNYLGRDNARQGGFNSADYTPPALEPLLKRARRTLDPKKRFAIYVKILNTVAIDVAYLGIADGVLADGISSKVVWRPFGGSVARRWGPWPLDIKAR